MWFRKKDTETEDRAGTVDVGQLYSALHQFSTAGFNWSISPAILASSLSVSDGGTSIITESRRLSRVSPLLVAYLRCMSGSILVGAPERPEFADTVPERVATAAADLWEAAHDCDRERDLLHKVMIDGELIVLDDGMVVPADGYQPQMSGPGWNKDVTGYKVGQSASVRRAGVFYLGDRRMGDHRAVPWIGPSLPFASALLTIRVAAGHGLAAMAKVTAVVANSSPDRITAAAGARTGVVASAGGVDNEAGRVAITSTGIGSVPFLRPARPSRGSPPARTKFLENTSTSSKWIAAGPDETGSFSNLRKDTSTSSKWMSPPRREPAALHELLSDYSGGTGSFAKHRMIESPCANAIGLLVRLSTRVVPEA